MSSVGFGLLRTVLSEDGALSALHEFGIDESYFQGSEKEAYRFIYDYFMDFGRLPQLDTVATEIDKRTCFEGLPEEPMDFWVGKVKERKRYRLSSAGLTSVREKLEGNDVDGAVDEFGRIFTQLKETYSEFRAVNLKDSEREVVEHHNRVQESRIMPGIPFGFPYLDAISGGLQPGDSSVIAGLTGAGKCLKKHTKIIMYSGEIKEVQDVQVGDLLMGPDSTPRRVRSTSIGHGPMYRVTPVKGDPFECNGDHILSLRCTYTESKKGKPMLGSQYQKDAIINISVLDWLEKSNGFKHRMKLWRTGVDFPERRLLIDPYIAGLYLGDGHKVDPKITFNIQDKESIDYFLRWADCNEFRVTEYSEKGNCVTYRINDDLFSGNRFDEYRSSLFDSDEKVIPFAYKANSLGNRLNLLAGILDSDGSLSNGGYDFITKYPKLANDIAFLARSLGFSCYISKTEKSIKDIGFTGTYYRLSIYGDCERIPCKVSRKKAATRKQKKNVLNTGFKIERIEDDDYYGFDIDGDHLFLLGDFTITHNTFLALRVGLTGWYSGANVLCLCTEMPVIQVSRRILSMEGNFDSTNLKLGRMSAFGIQRAMQIIDSPLHIDGQVTDNWFKLLPGGLYSNLDDVLLITRELRPDLLILDGASLIRIKGHKAGRWERMIDVMEAVKNFAMEVGIATLSTYHFNKQQPGTTEGIYGGLAMSQLASIVMSFEYERKEDRNNPNPVQYRVLKLLKGRDGETGSIRCLYNMLRSSITQDRVIQGYTAIGDGEDEVEYVDNDPVAVI